MSGDPRCPYCRAPEPAYGEIQHARDCPLAIDEAAARFREPKERRKTDAKRRGAAA
jgi:hypothetical protein